MLVFDDGNFSEYETVLLTDWMAHTPPDVVAKNFGVAQSALAKMPKREKFIFHADVPGSLADDQRIAAGSLGVSPIDFAFRTTQHPAPTKLKSGEVRVIDSSSFKIATTVAAAIVTVRPGGMRELHWHPNADEWQFYISGKPCLCPELSPSVCNEPSSQGRHADYRAGPRLQKVEQVSHPKASAFEIGRVGRLCLEEDPLKLGMHLSKRDHGVLESGAILILSAVHWMCAEERACVRERSSSRLVGNPKVIHCGPSENRLTPEIHS